MARPKVQSDEWLGAADLARRWGVSASTVYGLLVERKAGEPLPPGKLPALRVAGQLRVHVGEVEAFEAPAKPSAAEVAAAARKALRVYRRGQQMAAVGAGKDYLSDL